ncbi:MAG: ABC transporter permease, partial [Bacteroidota bacterium]
MISNYIKLAWRVLGRNKFFSTITLFGISFTLAILMLIVSFLETEVGSTKPVSDRDKMVVLPYLHLSRQYYDTIFVYDTLIVDEEFVIDTTYNLEEAGSSNSNSQYAWWFLDRYFSDVDHVRDHTFFNSGTSFNAYVNNSKVEMNVIYADHGFWDVFDFRFREGFGFDNATVDQESPVAIVTTDLADEYFGRRSGILGEELIMNGRTYKVTGLIDPPGVSILTFDIVVPRTLLDENSRGVEMGFGGYMASFVGEKSSDVELIKESISVIESTIEIPAPAQEDFDRLRVNEQSYHEIYADQILDLDEPEDSLRV